MGDAVTPSTEGKVAFVLGGGGLRGAAEVGMLKALAETDIRPDMVVGTSIGSINGSLIASGDFETKVAELEARWEELAGSSVLRESWWGRASNIVRHRTHLHSNAALRDMLEEWLPQRTFEELSVDFSC